MPSDPERYRAALEEIHSHYLRNERNTYMPAAETLDRFRRICEDALGLPHFTEDNDA